MRARRIGLGILLAASSALTSASALAQTATGRGQLVVVGLRAPDGDDEAAQHATNALRALATETGWTVPNSTPGLEQEFTVVGCDNTGPDCLARIAEDVHATRFIYGNVTRIGRGREARIAFELAYWDNTDRRVYHQESREMLRADGRLEGRVREEIAQLFPRIVDGVPDDQTRARGLREAQEAEAQRLAEQARIRQLQTQLAQRPTVVTRAPIVRYVGFGLIGVGAIMGGIGIWQALNAGSIATNAQNAGFNSDEPYRSWFFYDNQTNPDRALSTSEVCANAQTDAVNAYAAETRTLCSNFNTSRTLGYALGLGGLAVAATGAVLAIIDRPRRQEAAPAPNAPAMPARQASRVRLRVDPFFGPSSGGANLHLTF